MNNSLSIIALFLILGSYSCFGQNNDSISSRNQISKNEIGIHILPFLPFMYDSDGFCGCRNRIRLNIVWQSLSNVRKKWKSKWNSETQNFTNFITVPIWRRLSIAGQVGIGINYVYGRDINVPADVFETELIPTREVFLKSKMRNMIALRYAFWFCYPSPNQ